MAINYLSAILPEHNHESDSQLHRVGCMEAHLFFLSCVTSPNTSPVDSTGYSGGTPAEDQNPFPSPSRMDTSHFLLDDDN
ncbi:hypothetical protein TNIN_350451 [Trichonephila inaurata madagascariensis]|uniref:Uncharacterized protein n=1 Tax=Trichonephila inaurata madagascariensis TaxID=2747483 RepID=A0A8X7CNW5_9ARAC|nr:hypothetical protein TNIN_350451 [Trichonephila inaurata madagascariensis]